MHCFNLTLNNKYDDYLLKETAETGSECAGRVLIHDPVFTSQTRTLSSKEPDTTKED